MTNFLNELTDDAISTTDIRERIFELEKKDRLTEDEAKEYKQLTELEQEIDFAFEEEEIIIEDYYFSEYAKDVLNNLYSMDNIPDCYINYDRFTNDLEHDYYKFNYNNKDYLVRAC